ncbi:tRNA pseudouridine(13) synthase TruD [Marinithermus hydrothermalis]|uniref:tRNA pseudouridine synthase D n=1 Tax=Marinithermus hydrothermalis (strain DSM 14884 / JCM 11576 / T1) TaxID=869210 RepID=F2NP90_MARHT|nr:tRNA pseudouridine(13) synthase TruD [Marinithermus hydrothermalis]AEB11891.1 tRNA pseudouridine synthase D [Marinithermus hydrothermalis DSM 14884]
MTPELTFDFDRYPYLTADQPGIGGRIRVRTRDFQVEEVPAYPPSGQGEHLFIHLEKEGLTTRQVFEYIRDEMGVPEKLIGVAGLKDKHALTRQWFSIPKSHAPHLPRLERLPGVRVLEAAYHRNKLGVGHLKGNRFAILVRDPEGPPERARAILEALAAKGVPNYYGPQRFGIGGKNPERGYRLVTTGKGRGTPWLKKFLIGSLQSLLFNDWVALRLERGLYDRVVKGDIAKKHDSGGEFRVEDPEAETPRAQRLEISATGPLYGRKYFEATDEARRLEDAVLARYGLAREQFRARKGARRPVRFPLTDWSVEVTGEGVWLRFFLPKGSYATAVLREVMKKNPEAEPLEEEGL